MSASLTSNLLLAITIGLWVGGAISLIIGGWYFFRFLDCRRPGYFWHVNLLVPFAIFVNRFWTEDGLSYRAKFLSWFFMALAFGGAFAGLVAIYGPLVPPR